MYDYMQDVQQIEFHLFALPAFYLDTNDISSCNLVSDSIPDLNLNVPFSSSKVDSRIKSILILTYSTEDVNPLS